MTKRRHKQLNLNQSVQLYPLLFQRALPTDGLKACINTVAMTIPLERNLEPQPYLDAIEKYVAQSASNSVPQGAVWSYEFRQDAVLVTFTLSAAGTGFTIAVNAIKLSEKKEKYVAQVLGAEFVNELSAGLPAQQGDGQYAGKHVSL